eukprot:2167069-Rhodomonas_salina.1
MRVCLACAPIVSSVTQPRVDTTGRVTVEQCSRSSMFQRPQPRAFTKKDLMATRTSSAKSQAFEGDVVECVRGCGSKGVDRAARGSSRRRSTNSAATPSK